MIMDYMFKVRVDECIKHTTGNPEQDEGMIGLGASVKFTLFINGMCKAWQNSGQLTMDTEDYSFFCDALKAKAQVVFDEGKLHKFLEENPGIL